VVSVSTPPKFRNSDELLGMMCKKEGSTSSYPAIELQWYLQINNVVEDDSLSLSSAL
jgi:hypothetical protein